MKIKSHLRLQSSNTHMKPAQIGEQGRSRYEKVKQEKKVKPYSTRLNMISSHSIILSPYLYTSDLYIKPSIGGKKRKKEAEEAVNREIKRPVD